jgi:hypothetical protein
MGGTAFLGEGLGSRDNELRSKVNKIRSYEMVLHGQKVTIDVYEEAKGSEDLYMTTVKVVHDNRKVSVSKG